jgi:H+/Cl- antiporter ClcA
VLKAIPKFVQACLLGCLGGAMCGAVAGLIFDVLEPTQEFPPDGFPSMHLYSACLGAYSGGYIGLLVVPFLYFPFIRKTRLRDAFWPALGASIVGALAGLFLFPLLAIPLAVAFLFVALYWNRARHSLPER